ncbi:hypothetical protein, partial [Paracoccus benzoatiresistens]
MVVRAFRVLEPLSLCPVQRAMTDVLPAPRPPKPDLPPRLKALARQLAQVLRQAQRDPPAAP